MNQQRLLYSKEIMSTFQGSAPYGAEYKKILFYKGVAPNVAIREMNYGKKIFRLRRSHPFVEHRKDFKQSGFVEATPLLNKVILKNPLHGSGTLINSKNKPKSLICLT